MELKKKAFCRIFVVFIVIGTCMLILFAHDYNSPEAVEKRYMRYTEEYMSQFPNAVLLYTDSDYRRNRYIYSDKVIYIFSPITRKGSEYIKFEDTFICDNGQTINGIIHNLYFINKRNILLHIKDENGNLHYIIYHGDITAGNYDITYIVNGNEKPSISYYNTISITKRGEFPEGGGYIHKIEYDIATSEIRHSVFSQETNSLLGDERYLNYDFRQKEKLRRAEEERIAQQKRMEEERIAQQKRMEEERIAQQKRMFEERIAKALYVKSVLSEFKDDEPAAQKKYYYKKLIFKGEVREVEDNRGLYSQGYNSGYKYTIRLHANNLLDKNIDYIYAYSNDENVFNLSVDKQIVFEGSVVEFKHCTYNILNHELHFYDAIILQYQK